MKKTLSILLSILMVFSAFSVMPFSALAESETATTGSGTESDPWVVHNWAALKEKMALGGYIKLGEDAVDSGIGALDVPGGTEVTLDLNGFTVNRNLSKNAAYGYVISVSGELNIKDTGNGESGKITGGYCKSTTAEGITYNGGGLFVNGGTVNMYGGSVCNNKTDYRKGGGLNVSEGVFNMYGGSINNNRGNGVLLIKSAFHMYDGTIKNNTSDEDGGGVAVLNGSTFVMDGGSISENYGPYGGGVAIKTNDINNLSSFTMNGGYICNNSGEYDAGGVFSNGKQIFNLNGGSITDNHCDKNQYSEAAGVWFCGDNFSVKGKPVVKDNYMVDGSTHIVSNVYIPVGGSWTGLINISGALEDGAEICVTRNTFEGGAITSGFAVYNQNEKPTKYFKLDKNNYANGYIISKNDECEAVIKQGVNHTVTFNSGGGEGTMDPVDVEEGTEYTLPSTCGFAKEGRAFYGWKIGDKLYDNSEEKAITVNQDTELTAVWAYSRSTQIDNFVDSSTTTVNGTLKLTDKRTGEVYTKVFSETAPSEFLRPTNPTITAIIEETKAAMLEEAKSKAGKYEVTVLNNDVTSLVTYNVEDNRKFKGLNPNDADIPAGYPIKDDNGDYYRYVTVNGTCSKDWVFCVEFEGEFTSEAPAEPEPQKQDEKQKPEPQKPETKPSAPVLSPEDAALPTAKKTEQAVKNTNTDKGDIAGSLYEPLRLKATTKKKTVTLKWKAQSGADGYIIYGAPCGQKLSKLADVKTTKYTFKKLKKGKYYKYVVVAYKKTAVDNRVLSVSKSVHISTKGGKKGNPKGIKVKKKLSLKKGKKAKLKAKLLKKGKVATHIAKLRYESSNPAVATVDKKGKVKALKKGKATIYVYTQDGNCKTVKVNVK